MTEPKEDTVKELCDLLNEAGVTVTIDYYRDISKGCGTWCRGWNKEAQTFCGNHMEAIRRGDYVMPGGVIRKQMRELYQKLKDRTDLLLEIKAATEDYYKDGGVARWDELGFTKKLREVTKL